MKIKRFKKRNNRGVSKLHQIFLFVRQYFWYILGAVFSLSIILLIGYMTFLLPSVRDADQLSFSESTIIYNRKALDPTQDPDDHVLYVIHGDENREYIPYQQIPQSIIDATLAIEDDSFFSHFGFDIGGVLKGFMNHFFGIGRQRGGSTITQQLVKNTFLSDRAYERSVARKFDEILLSMKMEWVYSKEKILEMYLNNIPYGNNAHGIAAAAKTFLDKSVDELTLGEVSVLVGLPARPTFFSPYGSHRDLLLGYYDEDDEGDQEYKKGRKDLVLERMLDLGMIDYAQFESAWLDANNIVFRRPRIDIQAPHFVFYVRQQVEDRFGKEFLRNGGLRIYTTLDPDMQQAAEEIIATKTVGYESKYGALNVAMTAIDPLNGEILAYVGGKNFFDEESDGQVDVLMSYRQPGSSFKPFVYASAFEQGYAPATVLFDVETDFGGNYKPQNFDGQFLGPVSLRESLNRSLNIPAIKTAFLADPERIMQLARRVGIDIQGTHDEHGVALGVGVAEVRPLTMINAYQVFAGDGSYFEPQSILEIRNSEGMLLEKLDSEKQKHEGIDSEIAALMRHVLTDESTRPTTGEGEEAFDWNILLQLKDLNNGVKTGTSNRVAENPDFNDEEPENDTDNRRFITVPGDSWTIGFTPYLISGVWVGNNKGAPMKSGATGLTVAAPLWRDFMHKGHDILYAQGVEKGRLYNEPQPLEVRKINKYSGKIATDLTPAQLAKEEVFARFSVPIELDNSIQEQEIDRRTGRIADANTPFYAREKSMVLTGLTSIRSDLPHWQKPVEEWIERHPKFLTSLGTIKTEDESNKSFSSDEKEERLNRLYEFLNSRRDEPSRIADPFISIQSPTNNGSISAGSLSVRVAVNATRGVDRVEYYVNDEFMAESKEYPFTQSISFDTESVQEGDSFSIRAVVFDQAGNMNQDQVTVVSRSDQEGPRLSFLGPVDGQKIVNGSFVHFQVDAQDEQSGVQVVEFYINDQSLGFVDSYPYEIYFSETLPLGLHTLKVKTWDLFGNESESSITVEFVRERIVQYLTPAIDKVTPYQNFVTFDVVVPKPELVEWVQLIAGNDEEPLFNTRIMPTSRFAQFHVQKRFIPQVPIELRVKWKNKDEIEVTASRVLDL